MLSCGRGPGSLCLVEGSLWYVCVRVCVRSCVRKRIGEDESKQAREASSSSIAIESSERMRERGQGVHRSSMAQPQRKMSSTTLHTLVSHSLAWSTPSLRPTPNCASRPLLSKRHPWPPRCLTSTSSIGRPPRGIQPRVQCLFELTAFQSRF